MHIKKNLENKNTHFKWKTLSACICTKLNIYNYQVAETLQLLHYLHCDSITYIHTLLNNHLIKIIDLSIAERPLNIFIGFCSFQFVKSKKKLIFGALMMQSAVNIGALLLSLLIVVNNVQTNPIGMYFR